MLKEMTMSEYLDKLEAENDSNKSYDDLMTEVKILEGIEKNIDFLKYLV